MMLAENTFAGLTVLQIALVSLAVLIVAMNVYSGWQNGVVRQIFRILAILAGYLIGFNLGPILAPSIPLGEITGSAQVFVVSILTGFVAYVILRFIINMLFRRTREQESLLVRLVYGSGGALIGLVFSLVFIIIAISAIRSIGTITDAQFRVAEKRHTPIPEGVRLNAMTQISKARQAIETGPIAAIVETIDPTPVDLYKTLERIATITSDPDAINRFISFPGTRQLMEHPSLKKLADDPEVLAMAQKKDFVGLLRNPKVLGMMQDESLRAKLKTFEFTKAMDFALKPGPAAPVLSVPPAPVDDRVY